MATVTQDSLRSFWQGKRVLITGHTGFKGSWLSLWLSKLGAELMGVSLDPSTKPSLWEVVSDDCKLFDLRHDIRGDLWKLDVKRFDPEIIFHMAAQPLVVAGWEDPHYTFDVNVMGTANLLLALNDLASAKVCVVVTSDKVYKLDDSTTLRKEISELGGADPYSASKSCVEIMVSSWPVPKQISVATARSGNVIGGGDWSRDRLMPDIINSIQNKTDFVLRNPDAIRPWQHVVEPLAGYLAMAESLYLKSDSPKVYNFGPRAENQVTVQEIIDFVATKFTDLRIGESLGFNLYKESLLLLLDSTLASEELKWKPVLDWKTSVTMTLEWYFGYYSGEQSSELMWRDIDFYMQRI